METSVEILNETVDEQKAIENSCITSKAKGGKNKSRKPSRDTPPASFTSGDTSMAFSSNRETPIAFSSNREAAFKIAEMAADVMQDDQERLPQEEPLLPEHLLGPEDLNTSEEDPEEDSAASGQEEAVPRGTFCR